MATVQQHGHPLRGTLARQITIGTAAITALSAATLGIFRSEVFSESNGLIHPPIDEPPLKKIRPFRAAMAEDVTFLNSHLRDLRHALTWKNHEFSPRHRHINLFVEGGVRRLEWLGDACKFEGYDPTVQVTVEAVCGEIDKIKTLNTSIKQGAEITQDKILDFYRACGLLKGAQFQACSRKDLCKAMRRPLQTIFTNVSDEPVSGEIIIKQPIGKVLRKLWSLSETDRRKLNIGITNTDTGRVLEIKQIDDPSYTDKPLDIRFQNDLVVRGKKITLDMPMRQTTERVNTGWTGLGLANDGAIIVRNRLSREVPVDRDFGISQYDTCLVFTANKSTGHKNETVVRFDVSSELIFYGSSSLYSGARKITIEKALARLVKRKDDGLANAEKLINGLMDHGAAIAFKDIKLPQ